MNGKDTSSPKIIIKVANIFRVLVIPAIVLSSFIKNTVEDCGQEGTSKPRGKLCGVFPTHTLPPLFLYDFHPFRGHLVQGCWDLQPWVPHPLFTDIGERLFNYKISVNTI